MALQRAANESDYVQKAVDQIAIALDAIAGAAAYNSQHPPTATSAATSRPSRPNFDVAPHPDNPLRSSGESVAPARRAAALTSAS